MNKNLKKVISSVVAVALSLGSLSAFAASFSDLPETAESAAAVNELSALGIIDGYEDGTFKPDEKVTRAQVTKMIVAALGRTAAATSAAGPTKFTDVAADHWASGYINNGSSDAGFINGMGDGTFQPEGNVTYAQLVKMLVASLGYAGMAAQEGSWPTGYLTVGERIGVTKSLTLSANDELTRGQVAILIDNSLNIPLLVNTVWSQANPEYEIKDDKGKDWQTMLTQYHDTYKVEGKITATSKSESGLDAGEAYFDIAIADRFDDNEWVTRTESTIDRRQKVYVATGINATDELFAYSTALIHKNDDDEYELICLNTSAKSKIVTLDAGGFDDENTNYKGDVYNKISSGDEPLKYYSSSKKTGKTSDYKLSFEGKNNAETTAELWVNGKSVGYIDTADQEDVENFLINNDVGTVTLIDAPQEGKATTDGYYDYILVTYYKSAVVSDVLSNGTVYFDTKEDGLPSNIKFDQDKVKDGDLEYSITLDGKEIDFTDLQEDDVVAIAYDVKDKPANSEFYDVIVTRGTVEGKVSSMDSDDEEYTVNGTTYSYDKDLLSEGYNDEAVGMEATLYVDAFGRVVKLEETSSSKKYAILENVWHETGADVYKAKLILPDGSIKDYELKEDDDADDVLAKIVFEDVGSTKATVDSHGDKKDITDRVVTYKVNSSNLLYDVKPQDGKQDKDDYKNKSNKIGSVKFNDNTKFIDSSEYVNKVSDLNTVSLSSLVDDTEYEVYGYDKLSDGTYNFVVITEGIGGYSDDTELAVVVKTSQEVDSEGEDKDAVTVLYKGEEKIFIVDSYDKDGKNDDSVIDDVKNLNKGDVITFRLNGSGEIKQINRLASMNISSGTSRKTGGYAAWYNTATTFEPVTLMNWAKYDENDVLVEGYNSGSDIELVFGAITDKTSNGIELTPYGGNDKARHDYDFDSDTKVYVYDYDQSAKSALFVGTKADIVKTSIPSDYEDDSDNILWDDFKDAFDDGEGLHMNFALVRTDGDDIQEIYVILGVDPD